MPHAAALRILADPASGADARLVASELIRLLDAREAQAKRRAARLTSAHQSAAGKARHAKLTADERTAQAKAAVSAREAKRGRK